MNETALEKRIPAPLKEKAQYGVAFGVIALMLYVAGFPVFLLFFVGVLTFFIWKVFSAEGRTETRRIFEFYLSANEILRADDRRWYGFEIQDAIARGEAIIRTMSAAPPLVYFSLGALYQKIGDHSSALRHLSQVVGESSADEAAIVFPTKELREYVRMLRKIERAPAEAPLTSSAIRSLERTRKNRGKELLEYSRGQLANTAPVLSHGEQDLRSIVDAVGPEDIDKAADSTVFVKVAEKVRQTPPSVTADRREKNVRRPNSAPAQADRKTISEVLRDIYDTSAQ